MRAVCGDRSCTEREVITIKQKLWPGVRVTDPFPRNQFQPLRDPTERGIPEAGGLGGVTRVVVGVRSFGHPGPKRCRGPARRRGKEMTHLCTGTKDRAPDEGFSASRARYSEGTTTIARLNDQIYPEAPTR